MTMPAGALGVPGLEGHSAVAVGETVLVYGGRKGPAAISADAWLLHQRTLEWRQLLCRSSAPPARCYHTASLYGGRMLVFGGLLSVGVDDVHYNRYNVFVAADLLPPAARAAKGSARLRDPGALPQVVPATGETACYYELDLLGPATWSCPLTTGRVPEPRSHHTAAVSGDTLYIYGGYSVGTNGRPADDRTKSLYQVHGLCMSSHVWRCVDVVETIPPFLWGSACVLHRDILFVHGGVDVQTGREEGYLCAFHLVDQEWRWLIHADQRAPGPLGQHSAVQLGDRAVYFGGCRDYGGTLTNHVHVLSLADGDWKMPRCTGESPPPLRGHAAVQIGGRMLVVGGADADAHRTSRCWSLDVESWHWHTLSCSFAAGPVDCVAAAGGDEHVRRLNRMHRSRAAARRAASPPRPPQPQLQSPPQPQPSQDDDGRPPTPSSDEESAAVRPAEVAELQWGDTVTSWEDFVARPSHKAFAVTAPDPASGQRWWSAHWGAASAEAAIAEVLRQCRQHGLAATLVYPPAEERAKAALAKPWLRPPSPPRAAVHPGLYSSTPPPPFLSRPAAYHAIQGHSSGRAAQTDALQSLGEAVFFAGPLGLRHGDPLDHKTSVVQRTGSEVRYGFVDLCKPLPEQLPDAAPLQAPYATVATRPARPAEVSPARRDPSPRQSPRHQSPRAADGLPRGLGQAAEEHKRVVDAAAARDAAERASRLFAGRRPVPNTRTGRQRYTSPAVVRMGLTHKLASNLPPDLQGPLGGTYAASHPYGRSVARDSHAEPDLRDAAHPWTTDQEQVTTATAIPAGLGPISAAAFLSGLQVPAPGGAEQLYEAAEAAAALGDESEREAEEALRALPADLRNAAATAYRERWHSWGFQQRLDAVVRFADAQEAAGGMPPVLPPPDAGSADWRPSPHIAPNGPVLA
eukprot:TRINITY_DN22799_c0_g1_i1.p1 TRINITY_DN22799_c0_g1~~TRINITY_DN22799_c0_g1_i1.p1  ORF type:complete len:928 (+),score=224.98 TRINITY_DN22799_c0_g1_i1:42-2786(+)